MAKTNNINVFVCEGNIVRDAEAKNTKNGHTLVTFSLAVNESYGENEWVSYFDFTIWGKYAEVMHRYLTKGSAVVVEAKAKQDRWEQEGQKRSKVGFTVKSLRLLGGKRQQSDKYSEPETVPDASTFDDDIPF